jgi:peptide/nickel transport system ATP-binding protein
MSAPLLSVSNLSTSFFTSRGEVQAVRGVSFELRAGEILGIVGESGSGKSVISQAIMGLLPNKARITGGRILFRDPVGGEPVDIAALDRTGSAMRAIRGNRIAIIFQEPMTSLSPLHTIGDQIGESARLHRGVGRDEARRLTLDMLRLVQFPNPARAVDAYPFELSGGLRQRAMIAMALLCRPALLIADEPTTALDVTIQAEILKLIKDLQSELAMSVLMVTHDFGVVANIADEVVVIYHGRIKESGPVEEIFRDPQHDYLKALLRAVPRFHMEPGERLVPIRPIEPRAGGFLHAARETVRASTSTGPILTVEAVTKAYGQRRGAKPAELPRAMDTVSFSVRRGECLGLVGESGCGKTTLSKVAIMRAVTPRYRPRSCFDDGKDCPIDISTLQGEDLRRLPPQGCR